ncbi:MAG: DUF456 domain-containing protein [Lautropia sp.]
MTIALWILCVLLIVVGLAGTVLPMLPGVVLVFAGILLGAWIDDFARVGSLSIWLVGLLGVLAIALDALAGAMGAKKAGASRAAVLGALVGTVLGILSGLWGLLFFPLIGAIVGQYLFERDMIRARNVGLATWLGMALGMIAKVVLAFMMVGVFIVALLID